MPINSDIEYFIAGAIFAVILLVIAPTFLILCAVILGARKPVPAVTDAEERMAAEERLLELREEKSA